MTDFSAFGPSASHSVREEAVELAKVFLATPFSGEERHARRIALLATYENQAQR